MKNRKKSLMLKATAFGMSLCLTIGLAKPTFAAPVKTGGVADSGINKNLNNGDLNSLGFTTSGDVKKDIDNVLANDKKPYGKNALSVYTAGELLIQQGNNGSNKTTLYDNDGNINKSAKWTLSNKESTNEKGLKSCDLRNLCELDANGDGRKNFVAQYYGVYNNNNTELELCIMDADNKVSSGSLHIGELPFTPSPILTNAYLALTTGDFDGDGKDEVAICDAVNHKIVIYRVNVSADKDGNTTSISLSYPERTIDLNYDIHKKFSCHSYGTKDNDDYKEQLELPVVSMCCVSQDVGSVDTLAFTVNYDRHQDDRKDLSENNKFKNRVDTYSCLCIVSSPLLKESTITIENLQWRWSNDYGSNNVGKDYASYRTQMAFAGVTSGDIDNDGENEIIVGGYNYKDGNISSNNWDLSDQDYLVNWFDYNSKNHNYEQAMKGAQFLSINMYDYNALGYLSPQNFGDAIYNGKNRYDSVISPFVMKCYSQRGTECAQSVFLNGLVLNLGSKTQHGYGFHVNNSSGIWNKDANGYSKDGYAGYPDNKLATCCEHVFEDKGFLVEFVVPLANLDWTASVSNRAIIDVTACTYSNMSGSGNTDPGIETLVFTYVQKSIGKDKYNQYVYSVQSDVVGDEGHINRTDPNSDNNKYTVSNTTFRHLDFTSKSVGYDNQSMLGIASPDVGHDSIIMRPEEGKDPDFYFSNPQVIAIMQADPYFDELDYTSDNGSTAFTSTKSGSNSVANDFSVTAGLSIGIETGFSLFDIVKIGFKTKSEAKISVGYTNEITTSWSTSRCFATSEEDSVALAMTPYIRYYYQIWDRDKQAWENTTVNIPREPQIAQIPVSQYDEVASGNGWDTIYNNVLYNTAGDPRTYSGAPKDFKSAGQAIGVGSGSGTTEMSITSENAKDSGVTWGFGTSNETEFTLGVFTAGFSYSNDYSGSYKTSSSNAYEYSGSVMTVPQDDYTKYNFKWKFGVWNSELNVGIDAKGKPINQKCIVLGYVCSDVETPPKAPDVHVYSVSDNSVTLKWDNDISYSDYYAVYRYMESNNSYHYLGTVQGNTTELDAKFIFTDKYCEPDTDYQYSVVAMKGSASQKSKNSRPVKAHTNPDESDILKISSSPSNFYAKLNESALFKVGAEAKGKGSDIKYQWQKYTEDGWVSLTNATNDVFQINSVIAGMNGKEYRCIVTRLVDGKEYSVISSPATLTVGDLSDTFIKETKTSDLIWFKSAVVGGKTAEIGMTAVNTVPDSTEYKPTYWNKTGLNLTVTGTKVEGNTITITYSDVTIGENNYISAMLVDSNDRIKYYGKIKKPDLKSGTCDIDLSSVSIAQNDSLYLFAEQISDENDYAGEPVEIPMSIRTENIEGYTITGIEVDADGNLIITLSNGEIKNFGKITGADGTNGKDGADGTNGKDGVDGTNGKDGVDGTNGKDGVDGTNGKDGVDGTNGKDGVDGTNGKDGNDGTNSKDGTDGKNGKDGKDGINGTNGKDGIGISNIALNDKGHYVVSMTNGNTVDVGKQVDSNSGSDSGDDTAPAESNTLKTDSGKNGVNGKAGTDGKDGADGKAGADGKDGIGVKTISMNSKGNFVFAMTDGSTIEVVNKQANPTSATSVKSNSILVYPAFTLSAVSCGWNGVTFILALKKRLHAVL